MVEKSGPDGGVRFGSIRKPDPQQSDERRAQLRQEITNLLANFSLPPQQDRIIPQPLLQQSSDTCLIACLVSVKKAISQAHGRRYFTTEQDVAKAAREKGILAEGGTRADGTTTNFIREVMNLQAEPLVSDPLELTKRVLEALQQGNFPLVTYSLGGSIDHWVAVVDVVHRNNETTIILMNPLKGKSFEGIDIPTFVNRIIGATHNGAHVSASAFIIKNSSD